MKKLIQIILIISMFVGNIYAQDVPRVISYQGVLVGADGKPVNSTLQNPVKIKFELVNAVGSQIKDLGTESNTIVVGGLFTKPLDLNGIQQNELNQQLFLRITVNDGTPYPLVPLYSSVSALNIPDNVVTSTKIKDGEVKAIDIGDNEVVKSIKGLKEAIDIVAGNPNIRIKVDGQNIVFEGKDTVKAAEQLIGGIPSGVPVGGIIAYWGNTPPDGWLLCDSSTIPSQYQSLIDFLGSSRTPDLRGMFLRGSNTTINSSSKGNDGDPDEGSRSSGIGVSRIGSRQGDAFQSHYHTISVKRTGGIQMNYVAAPGTYDDAGTAGTNMSGTSSETRPKNVYVNYIIKAR